ncbi:MAG: Flp/Fap pilin component [Sphingomonadales bacterium]|nr:Flp/Fap pilin component [Sphingomonadales bacterium]
MLGLIRALALDNRGANAIVYGLIAALVVVAMMGALNGLASVTIGMWNNVAANVSAH